MSTIEFAHQIKIIQRWNPCTYSYLVWPSLIFSILFSESLGSLFGLKHVAACVIQRFYRTMVPIVESALPLRKDSSWLRVPWLCKMTALCIRPAYLSHLFCLMGVPERSLLELLLFYTMIALVCSTKWCDLNLLVSMKCWDSSSFLGW